MLFQATFVILFRFYQISEFYVIPSVPQKKESYGFRITENVLFLYYLFCTIAVFDYIFN